MTARIPGAIRNTLEELRVLEREIERQWWWLNGALHAAAQGRAERPYADPKSFRELQAQVREVDRQRVQLAVRIAEIEAHAQSACGSERHGRTWPAQPQSASRSDRDA
jgi:hypothetical protein